jgi:hypothetical protein
MLLRFGRRFGEDALMKASYFGHVGVIGTCFLLFLARWSIYVVAVVGILVVGYKPHIHE